MSDNKIGLLSDPRSSTGGQMRQHDADERMYSSTISNTMVCYHGSFRDEVLEHKNNHSTTHVSPFIKI